MKFSRLVLALLLAAGFLNCFGAPCPQQHSGSGDFHDIAAFREARMKFPERHEFFCPVAVGPLPECRLVQSRKFDLDGDGIPEKYTLRDGRITVLSGDRVIWRSPDNWWVDFFFLGDANNDGTPELNLLVWKEGSFGLYKPFWVKEEDSSVKNHLFIFKLEKGNFKPVWQSSNLDRPNYRIALIDLNGDGENELVVTEGSYTDPGKKEMTLWKWNGWGFSRINLGDRNSTVIK